MGSALLGPFGRHELGTDIVTIGRQPFNTIVLLDDQTSGRHAEVRQEGTGYLLIDLGSTNGSSVNGQKLSPHTPQRLHSGDVITIGSSAITVELAGAALPPTVRLNAPAPSALPPTQRIALPPNAPGSPGTPAAPPSAYRAPGPLPPPAYAPPPPNLGAPLVVNAPPPKKRSTARRILLIVGGSLALALIVCVTLGVIVVRYVYTHSPEGVVNAYYSEIQNQQYNNAYTYMDSPNKQLFTFEAQQKGLADGSQLFAIASACLDKQFGPVTAFSTTLLRQSNSEAAVRVSVTRPHERYIDTIGLIPEQGNWKIALFELPPGQQCIDIIPGQ